MGRATGNCYAPARSGNYKPQKALRQGGVLAPDLKDGNHCCLATANSPGGSCECLKAALVSPQPGC